MTTIVGLTGSIGTGKSTTAKMFAEAGLPVWDADAAVHKLYAKGGAAVSEIAALFPSVIVDGAVSRVKLRDLISVQPEVLDQIQSIVHPLVAADRQSFIGTFTGEIILLDIPLLFETGASDLCDVIVVVTTTEDIQRARVLSRGEMTEDDFQLILSRQIPDTEKRARADFVVETLSLETARATVRDIVEQLKVRHA